MRTAECDKIFACEKERTELIFNDTPAQKIHWLLSVKIAHTTAFVIPVVEQELYQWVQPGGLIW